MSRHLRCATAPQLTSLRPHSALRILRHYSQANAPATPPQMDDGERAIHAKLAERFKPSQLQVQDVSGGCGTFYAIMITSQAFKGLSVVKQHRLVTQELKAEIEGIHGLQINTIPEE
ncbi:bola-like protein [Rickenella mellea]|uniref:Bola-like protein n=1 Tax=Rickenella mellea TaxID=50990 RepID=A0A4V3AZN5_9AGAM|nr:bola-like protein [Rickenella mellea]